MLLADGSGEQLAQLLEEAHASIVRKIEEREMDMNKKQARDSSAW